MMLSISTTKLLIAELAVADYNFHRWTSKPTEYYSVNSKPTCKPPELHTIMKKCNGTGMVLKICETKNNVWKRHILSIQNSIDNHIKTTRIKPNFASLNNVFKCPFFRQPFYADYLRDDQSVPTRYGSGSLLFGSDLYHTPIYRNKLCGLYPFFYS